MNQPLSLRVAAMLVAVEAAGIAIFGLVAIGRAVAGHPHDRGTAIFLGAIFLCYAAAIGTTAVGLQRARRWAQTPTYLIQSFTIVIGVLQVHTIVGFVIPLLAVSVAIVVAVSLRASRDALGGI